MRALHASNSFVAAAAATDIVWNAQWPELCPGPSPPADAITRYGVRANATNTFNGDVVSTLYNNPGSYTIGDWPCFSDDGTPTNNGIPQLANLSRHLDQVRADVVRLFPDPAFSGWISTAQPSRTARQSSTPPPTPPTSRCCGGSSTRFGRMRRRPRCRWSRCAMPASRPT